MSGGPGGSARERGRKRGRLCALRYVCQAKCGCNYGLGVSLVSRASEPEEVEIKKDGERR